MWQDAEERAAGARAGQCGRLRYDRSALARAHALAGAPVHARRRECSAVLQHVLTVPPQAGSAMSWRTLV
jgi:hypothetical protein